MATPAAEKTPLLEQTSALQPGTIVGQSTGPVTTTTPGGGTQTTTVNEMVKVDSQGVGHVTRTVIKTGPAEEPVPVPVQTQTRPVTTQQPQRYVPPVTTTVAPVNEGSRVTTIHDRYFIASVYLSAFSSALSFAGVWNVANVNANLSGNYVPLLNNPVSKTYAAFAFLFLIFSHFETWYLIVGLVKAPVARTNANSMALLLSIWNIILLIIAISCEFTSLGLGVYKSVAPACLLAALGTMTACFCVQISAIVVHGQKDPKLQAGYIPYVFTKTIVRDLLIAAAALSEITLAFAIGGLFFVSPIEDQKGDWSQTWLTGAAFQIIFFFTALVQTIISIVALCPSDAPIAVNVFITWLFALLSFIVAFIAWLTQLSAQGPYQVVASQFTMVLIGWIFALATLAVALSAYLIIEDGYDACNPCTERPSRDLVRERNLAEIEKAKHDAAHYRRQRENLEAGNFQTANV